MPSDPNARQFWWCGGKEGCGHVVGEIGHKDMQEGGRMKVLLVYEQSLDVPPIDVPTLRGQVPSGFEMRCTLCNSLWEWYLSKASLNKLLMNYQVRHG
jgi:hypothetical protein